MDPDQVLESRSRHWQRGHDGSAGFVGGRPSSVARVLVVAGERPRAAGWVLANQHQPRDRIVATRGRGQAMLSVKIRRVFLARHRVDFRRRFDGLLAEAFQLGAEPVRRGLRAVRQARPHAAPSNRGRRRGALSHLPALRGRMPTQPRCLHRATRCHQRSPPRSCRCCSRGPASPCTSVPGPGVSRACANSMQNLDGTNVKMNLSTRVPGKTAASERRGTR